MITIGRVGYDVALNDPSTYDVTGDVVSITGGFRTTSVANFKTLRQQMLGLMDNPWEEIVPVTWSLDSTQDGFYRVLTTAVDVASNTYRSGWGTYSATLERLPGYSSGWVESVLSGADRSGTPGGVTPSTWHAVPSTVTAALSGGIGYGFTRTGPGGSVLVATNATKFYGSDLHPRFYLAPAHWYDMSANLTVGGMDAVGRQIVSSPASWELSNGLMKIAPDGTSSTLLSFTPIASRAGATYGSAHGLMVGYGGSTFVATAQSVTVLRNGPEECAIRLLCTASATAGPMFYVDVALRRGSLFATVTITGDTAQQWGISTTVVTAMSTQTGGMYATSGGNQTIVISSPKAFTTDLVNGDIYLTSAGLIHDLAVGFMDQTAPGATNPDRLGDLRDQFFAAITETQTVVSQ